MALNSTVRPAIPLIETPDPTHYTLHHIRSKMTLHYTILQYTNRAASLKRFVDPSPHPFPLPHRDPHPFPLPHRDPNISLQVEQ